MATPEEISERVKSIIVEQLGVSLEEVTPQASFIDEDAEKIQTVDDVTKYIQAKQS